MSATPTSQHTPHFDAPIANFHGPSSPVMETDSPAQLPPAGHSSGAADEKEDDVHPVPNGGPVTEITPPENSKDGVVRKGPVLKSSPPTTRSSSPPIGSQSRSMFTNADGQRVDGSTFIAGAGTTGPNSTAEPNVQLDRRAASADASLTPRQRSKIQKEEAKGNKRLSKIIKGEAKAEKEALSVAINELAELQMLQKQAIKAEGKAHCVQTKALSDFQKEERTYLAARTKHEAAQARLLSEEQALEQVRASARDVTERLQEKSQQVNSLRTTYAVDERERATKLDELAGHSSGCF